MIRAYILNQELADKQLDQMQLSSRPHKLQSTVPESFITAFGGSPSNPQLCWGLLARLRSGCPQDRPGFSEDRRRLQPVSCGPDRSKGRVDKDGTACSRVHERTRAARFGAQRSRNCLHQKESCCPNWLRKRESHSPTAPGTLVSAR